MLAVISCRADGTVAEETAGVARHTPYRRRVFELPICRRDGISAGMMTLLAAALVLAAPQPSKQAGLNTPPPVTAAFAIRATFGLKDAEPKPWNGSVCCDSAAVLKCEGWRFGSGHQVKQPAAWVVSTALGPVAPTLIGRAGEKTQESRRAPLPVGVVIYFDKLPNGPIAFKTAQGNFEVRPAALAFGKQIAVLGDQAEVERVPVPIMPASEAGHADYASVLPCSGGSLRLTAIVYSNSSDHVVCWAHNTEGQWSPSQTLSAPVGDHFVTAQAGGWVVWSRREGQEWNLIGRQFVDGKWGDPAQLTRSAGPDIFHAMAAGPNGQVWLTWQGFRGGKSKVFLKHFDGQQWGAEQRLSDNDANNWMPAIAADSRGRVLVAWDTYENGNYDVRARFFTDGRSGPVLKVTQSPLFHAHASVTFDKLDRAWIAWDESAVNWGKDTGFLWPHSAGARLYQGRFIRIAAVEPDGTLRAPAADIHKALPESPLFDNWVQVEVCELPKLIVDGAGRLWCFLRHRLIKVPREDGWAANGVWEILATCYDGKNWSAPVFLPHSFGRNDASLDLALAPDGAVWAAWQTDNRSWDQPAPKKGDVFVTTLGGDGVSPMADLRTREWTLNAAPAFKPTHPRESADVARMRAYTATVAGKQLKIYRGDLHRHTEQSSDGPGDGSLWDLYRYALDAVAFDFCMVTDHNDGDNHEYQWWRREKSNDLFLEPGVFVPLFGYERSVSYPNGHRNCIFAERGVHTLPLEPGEKKGKLNSGSLVYPYLRQFKGICTSHTSATDQGTDWRDNDPELEPVVEIFQGYHTSYETDGAPKAITATMKTVHGGYRPLGFVWLALEKGYRLGFQASSDHISTHVSYACVYTDDFTRQGLIDAIKKRHTYAATDNIIVDERVGEHFMGDEFDLPAGAAMPPLYVKVEGTAPVKQIMVIKNNACVFCYKPVTSAETSVSFSFSDAKAAETTYAYYYARVEQADGQLAWASPIWVNRQ